MVETPVKETPASPAPPGDLRERVQKLRLGGSGGTPSPGGIVSRIAWLPWILCALLAFSWAFVAGRAYRTGASGTVEGASKAAAPVKVGSGSDSAPVVAGTIQLEVKGYLMPAKQFAVSPIDVGGKIIELNFVEGNFYKKDFVLARIDSTNYNAAEAEAAAAYESAQSKVAAAKSRLRDLDPQYLLPEERQQAEQELAEAKANELRARQELERLKAIGGTNAVGLKEIQQAQADFDAAVARSARLTASLNLLLKGVRKPKLDAAEADVLTAINDESAAKQRLVQARWRKDNCVIKMPIDATVLSKKAELFNLVNPLAFGATSGSICDVADLSDLEVDIEIPERDISKLKVGQVCRVRADAFPERSYEGRLDRIMPIANRAKSIVNVRVKVKLPEGEAPGTYLKPEMGAVVSFLASEEKSK
jgi:multidrug resistance efflux pump